MKSANRVGKARAAMKTSDFIDSLVVDAVPYALGLTSRFWLALGFGAVVSVILFAIGVGPRADFVAPAHTLSFDLKFVETLALACPLRSYALG
jgi:hypothetical protein